MNICGENNEFIFKNINNEIIEYDYELLNNLNLILKGNNNKIIFMLNENETVHDFVKNKHIEIKLNGSNNIIDMGNFETAYEPYKGILGLEILIGGYGNEITNNAIIKTGKNLKFSGLSLHVKENNSKIIIGDNCLMSWMIYIWCTDGHTILDKNNNIINKGYSIEIGNHVWIGKDVKIGKNTKIPDNSIVGWNSVVTKKFDEKNIIIAGNPAKIIKKNVNWNIKCISEYENNI